MKLPTEISLTFKLGGQIVELISGNHRNLGMGIVTIWPSKMNRPHLLIN